MCSCDKDFALRCLPHQVAEGIELSTQKRVSVTLGFQPNICNTCRGIQEQPAPKAAMYGRMSKIYRYYWREIETETIRRFADWADGEGHTDWLRAQEENKDKYSAIEKQVVDEIKELHRKSPIYIYDQKSQDEVLSQCEVIVVNLDAFYIKTSDRKAKVLDRGQEFTAEEFAANYYKQNGYSVVFAESVPFHALFATLMWILIQDPKDERNRVVAFGDRIAFEEGRKEELIWIVLPDDFGSSGYFSRRKDDIDNHLESLPEKKEEIMWTFDYWIHHSYQLRQYLWAHEDKDIETARKILEILPVKVIKKILKYLVENYWDHYIGWPDLILYKDSSDSFFFAEVKSSNDKLSDEQKNWIENNFQRLKLPFNLVKIHKKGMLESVPETDTKSALKS